VAERSKMRGERYGEVLLGKGGVIMPKELDVYNSFGLNDCPQELWSKLDPEKIKHETGSKMVKLNGPRYWTVDGFTGTKPVSMEPREFGGIAMRHAGTLEVSIADMLTMGAPYTIHKVARTTTWIFEAGKPVYQLIDHAGHVYFMQSFSVESKQQTLDSLASLESELSLPKGWTFRSVVLSNNYSVTAVDGMAYVVQDDFKNTYQKSVSKVGDAL
jgi:hypothetical protein